MLTAISLKGVPTLSEIRRRVSSSAPVARHDPEDTTVQNSGREISLGFLTRYYDPPGTIALCRH